MALEQLAEHGDTQVTPMHIAANPLFTAREKIELLQRMKAEVAGMDQEGKPVGISPSEIEAAIAEVRHNAEIGGDAGFAPRGDA